MKNTIIDTDSIRHLKTPTLSPELPLGVSTKTGLRYFFETASLEIPEMNDILDQNASQSHPTVLVIDDDESIRDFVIDILTDAGMVVLAASGGQKGINLLRQHSETINIVVLDIEMPVMNGVEVYRQLTYIAPDMQVIFSSGRMPNSQVNDFLIHPNVTFLPKPYRGEQLIMEIKAALQ